MLDDTKPPLGSRIRSMILVYDAFGETYTDADKKFALKIMANLLKEVLVMILSELKDWLQVQIDRHEKTLEESSDMRIVKDAMAKLVAYKRTLNRAKGGQ